MVNVSKILLLTGFFIIILVSGIFLHKSGDTYNSIIFTVHKLCALILCITIIKAVVSIMKIADTGFIVNFFVVIVALSVIILFTTGIIMSINHNAIHLVSLIHSITTSILFISVIIIFLGAFSHELL